MAAAAAPAATMYGRANPPLRDNHHNYSNHDGSSLRHSSNHDSSLHHHTPSGSTTSYNDTDTPSRTSSSRNYQSHDDQQQQQQLVQPPALQTTGLANTSAPSSTVGTGLTYVGIGAVQQTPLSATSSLSTPFSQKQPHSAIPVTDARSRDQQPAAPMPFPQTASSTGSYNPQQWNPLSDIPAAQRTRRPQRYAPRLLGPDEPVHSPPPPYSPRRDQDSVTPRESDTVSPDITSPASDASHYTTPLTSARIVSPDYLARQSAQRGLASLQTTSPAGTSSNPASPPQFPPPPTSQPTSRLRSASKDHAGRILSSFTSRTKATGNVASPVAAIDTQSANSNTLAQSSTQAYQLTRPPASRRAASTSNIPLSKESSLSNSQSSSPWEPGVQIPPPPPGPPPSGTRSQSLNRPSDTRPGPDRLSSFRRPPGQGTLLDTVPPTPADWQDTDDSKAPAHGKATAIGPLYIDTDAAVRTNRELLELESVTSPTDHSHTHHRRDSSSTGLFRTPAVRNRSAKGLRERRSESKHALDRTSSSESYHAKSTSYTDDSEIKPSNLDLANPPHRVVARRDNSADTPKTGTVKSPEQLPSGSAKKSPFAKFAGYITKSPGKGTPNNDDTPPASAQYPSRLRAIAAEQMQFSHSPQDISPGTVLSPGTAKLRVKTQQRPVSHILHSPIDETGVLPRPLKPSSSTASLRQGTDLLAPESSVAFANRPTSNLIGPESPYAFSERAHERHRRFAAREAAASSNSERLELFVQYILAESRIRREQYGDVFDQEDVDVPELVKALFVLPKREDEQEASEAERRSSFSSSHEDVPASASQALESPDPSSATSPSSLARVETGGAKEYIPCLSPIASLSIHTPQDEEMNSRGRAPSRWWEEGSHGADDGFEVLGRTKRESKYMGVSREGESRVNGEASLRPASEVSRVTTSTTHEYPPEKVGWHEATAVPPPPPLPKPPTPSLTPDALGLDVSRLVTLPPPYPRHHPAMNNNHPALANIRADLRTLNEKEQIQNTRSKYDTEAHSKRKRANSWCERQRSLHRQDVQFRMDHGSMTQQEFDDLEAELESKIHSSQRDLAQSEFDTFQDMVVTPLHIILTKRIALATTSLETLSTRLHSDAQSPQEEGDEQPELLEKLTLLKWLFEAREQMHRRSFELLTERNELYRATVLLPFQQSHNDAKLADATAFFARDAQERLCKHEHAVLQRTKRFLEVVEHNVARGVEMQLDAFWQIAPSLRDVLHLIPRSDDSLGQIELRIPKNEYTENPSYVRFPLRYLSSLLVHAEKSTRQFIESQVNLLCLLHEIRWFTLAAECREARVKNERREHHDNEDEDDDEDDDDDDASIEDAREQGERKLTADLKEKVAVVEEQWTDALGEEMRGCRERVRGKLLEQGGWSDEDAEEEMAV